MKKYALFISTAILCLLFFKLTANYSNRFKEVESSYKNNGISANLTKGTDFTNALSSLDNIDKDDAIFLSRQINEKLNNGIKLSCISDLNKRVWQIPASVIDSIGSPGLKRSLASSRKSLGQGSKDRKDEEGYKDYQEYKANSDKEPASRVSPTDSLLQGIGVIEVKVYEKNESFIKRLLKKDETPCVGVLVRLSEHYMDSLNAARRTLLWTKTDSLGNAIFENLDVNRSYSVLPINEGFEYGSSKGTTKGSLSASTKNGTVEYKFAQQEHKIRMFDAKTLSQIKEKHILTVRSPKEYKSVLLLYLILFFGAWWGLYLLRYRRFKISDSSILSLMMLLTGLCILSMFSINDPLEDTLLGVDMAQGVVAGIVVMGLLQFVDFTKLYQNRLSMGFEAPLELPRWLFEVLIDILANPIRRIRKLLLGRINTLSVFLIFINLWLVVPSLVIYWPIHWIIYWLSRPFKAKVSYLTSVLANKKHNAAIKMTALILILLASPFWPIEWLLKSFNVKCNSLISIIKAPEKSVYIKILAILGMVVVLILSPIDLLVYLSKKALSIKGISYLITALVLTALLWSPFGSEVGGMKVNLNLGIKFQPSEIAKYLIIFFMAAFFSVNANKIMKYSAKGNVELFGHKLKMLSAIIIGLGILMVMYLVLGDMGPALVLAFTFIILYSIVKSKVNLESLDERSQNIKILTCDLAMLAYGVISFIVFLYIGNMFGGEYSMPVFCVLWFVLWIIIGLSRKQLFESAILFNLIISAFIFGSDAASWTAQKLHNISFLSGAVEKIESTAKRLDERMDMCTNTWGTLPIDDAVAEAGENTQVAEGLWGLASGGLWGQGLGNGSPNFIPAFHTDMILESIGEQLGFVGVFVVLLLLALLLRKTILLGYKTSHPFAFYLCLGISIVTAVQFIIISLGSTGIIPLTGVTVPFLSYGKVSMILNMAAFGIILSYNTEKVQDKSVANSTTGKNISQYNYSVSVLSWLYCGIALLICLVFFHYQFTDRNTTLVKPVYVHNADGRPVVEYNPRIAQLTNKMWAGDIYDRKGVLLATSDKSKIAEYESIYKNINAKIERSELKLQYETTIPKKRYYPFGNHLTYMLGEYGSDIASFRSENSGYVAEYRHMSELRGYDNKKYIVENGEKIPLKVTLVSDEFKPGRFIEQYSPDTVKNLQIRDYSALIPYLKAGYNSERVAKLNARDESFFAIGKIKPQDVQLTIDAELQTMLQYEIVNHIEKNLSGRNKLRVSVVILDAQNGDLLSSAIYPLPDEDRLREEQLNGTRSYRDVNKPRTWKSYSDVDLGLIYPSAPGSTAKVLVGLAGFHKEHDKIASAKYDVYKEEIIYNSGHNREEYGKNMSMEFAYNTSSNCYFINLLNDKELFDDLAYVYGELGISVDGEKSYNLSYEKPTNDWLDLVKSPGKKSIEEYRKYIASGEKSKFNVRKPDCWRWAYGQGTMDATPLAMARAVSAVVNDGKMPKTQYVLSNGNESISIIDNSSILRSYLKSTAKVHDKFAWTAIGGKTGTPERAIKTHKRQIRRNGKIETVTIVDQKSNDGWYVCFIEDATIATREHGKDALKKRNTPLAIAIRLERLDNGGSGRAVNLMKNVVKPTLEKLEYIQ